MSDEHNQEADREGDPMPNARAEAWLRIDAGRRAVDAIDDGEWPAASTDLTLVARLLTTAAQWQAAAEEHE